MELRMPHRELHRRAVLAVGLLAVAAAAIAATPPASRKSATLPDSVLARTGNREVTVREFLNAWKGVQPPTRPDSLTPENAREFLDLLVDKEVLGAYAMKEALPWS